MKKFYTFLICLVFTAVNTAFGAESELSISVSSEIKVCGSSKQSTITIINNSGATYTNPIFNIGLPTGIYYDSGSLAEST